MGECIRHKSLNTLFTIPVLNCYEPCTPLPRTLHSIVTISVLNCHEPCLPQTVCSSEVEFSAPIRQLQRFFKLDPQMEEFRLVHWNSW